MLLSPENFCALFTGLQTCGARLPNRRPERRCRERATRLLRGGRLVDSVWRCLLLLRRRWREGVPRTVVRIEVPAQISSASPERMANRIPIGLNKKSSAHVTTRPRRRGLAGGLMPLLAASEGSVADSTRFESAEPA